ncbi:hypothetical protein [uncultured Methylobacterium sp.]|uniref:hypothetical protein n=1 Tax=uncultured Methylobacterium sp. TaxID=157278 RepID=UPI0035CA0B68
MKLGIRSRLYGGFATLVVLAGAMGGFAYQQLDSLDDIFETRGRIERAARELYTVNGLTDRFVGQSTDYRAMPTQQQADGMNASLASIKQLADGLVERALSEERRAAYAVVRSETAMLAGEMPKLVGLGDRIREN